MRTEHRYYSSRKTRRHSINWAVRRLIPPERTLFRGSRTPKAGKLGTDLNRDKLFKLVEPHGIEGVRLVSIDDTWSAMRFRPSHSQ